MLSGASGRSKPRNYSGFCAALATKCCGATAAARTSRRLAPHQPPDSAPTIISSRAAATAPRRSRASAPSTKILMCGRTAPCSSTMRKRKPRIARVERGAARRRASRCAGERQSTRRRAARVRAQQPGDADVHVAAPASARTRRVTRTRPRRCAAGAAARHFQRPPFVAAAPDLAARRAEVDAHGRRAVRRHRLPLDRPPRLRLRQPGRLPLPRLAAVDRAVRRRLAARARCAARRSVPSIGNTHSVSGSRGCSDHRKADRADRLRHRRADVGPARPPGDRADRCRSGSADRAGPGRRGCSRTQCGSCPNSGSGSGRKSARTPWLSGCQSRAAIGRLEDAAARHADVQVLRVARIDEDRVQLRAVGRAVLVAAAPRLALRMLVEAVDTRPGRAAVGRAEQPLRRRARVPDAGLASRGPASARTCDRRCARCPA